MDLSRRALAAALVLAGTTLPACMDYQFSPVGRCVLQPGSVQVAMPKTASADLLFVVDDSPSMDPKQAGLAASFGDFLGRMVAGNVERTARGMAPVDFQIAITTSSIFSATAGATSCVGGNQCCTVTSCTNVASCGRGTADGCGGGQVCITDPVLDPTFTWVSGIQARCCTVGSCTASPGCAPGDRCPSMQTSYPSPFPTSQCTPGVATAGAPYPAGRFVGAGGNPKVLTFPKDLNWASWGTGNVDPRLQTLVTQFQQNVQVGSCGAGEEQHLEAARLALDLAFSGRQTGGGFPRRDAKLVVVWVGDEDDCSSPQSAPLSMAAYTPGADSCVLDKHLAVADQREIPVSSYASYLTGLRDGGAVADLGAAFIVASAKCADGNYAPADVCSGPPACPVRPPAACGAAPACGGAYAAGERFLSLAGQLAGAGVGVVEGTVCDAYPPNSFGPVLAAIADLARPPSLLQLPTMPGARAVTTLAILDGNGQVVKTCQEGTDWCFVDCGTPGGACLGTGTSQCIAINHQTGSCEANPGQTYSAEYLGRVPAGGCATAADCASSLGGQASSWQCIVEPGSGRGTCACQ
jgi:hypothetical protein